ncbi:MAG TPA: ArsA-related P-loop ATPase [Acidimicrobiia bacterium]|nr:ArsA-related P-loop ATPase [Acidimicrobiia bacterium]
MTSTSIEPLLASREIVVFCGSGGVGKTTTAAATALVAAAELGGRVLVLTIDPARRLADALGLESIGNVERRVPDEALRGAGLEPRGELFAAMLDTKASWDDLVLRHAPDEETAYKVLGNSLYQNITARFVQSHDYIAMERLYDLHTNGRYDLIVVDTPPTRNAIDFLEAPKRMAEFFGGRLLRWLTMPYRLGGRRGARVVNFASRPFYQLADRILGSQFLQDIAEFFLSFQSMYDGFVARAEAVERLLHDRRTTFAVVTTLEGAPLREAEFFARELTRRQYPFGAMVLNRVLPEFLSSADGQAAAATLADHADEIAKQLAGLDEPVLQEPDRVTRVLRTMAGTFRDYSVVATRERELRAEVAGLPEVVASVPAFPDDVHDLAGLAQIGRALLGTP